MKKSLYYYTSLFAWGVVFLLIVFYAFAWNPPTDNPPNANLPAPINTSSVEQTKTGNLNLGGLLRLGLLTSHPTGTNGAIYYNTTDNKFYGYQNNEWKELGSGGGASFWLASGDNIYNTNTGNVGIGTTAPRAKLDVAGRIWQTGTGYSVFLGEGAGASDDFSYSYNVFIGTNAGYSNTEGFKNTAVGYSALYSNIDGYINTALGSSTLESNTTGTYNTALGCYALRSNIDGFDNTAVGYSALYSNIHGYDNTAVGNNALRYNTGSINTAVGFNTLVNNTTGSTNTALGSNALFFNTTGSRNTALGFSAGRYISGGSASNATSTNSLYLGYDTRALASGDTNEIVIGYQATGVGSNSVVLGNDSITKTILKGNVGIGTTSPQTKLDVAGAIKIGSQTTCDANTAGAIRYNSSAQQFEGCNGVSWKLIPTNSPFVCGTSNVTFVYKGSRVTYGTVVGANNRCWLDRNLGALRVATAYNDELAYGDYFQWGRLDDGHQTGTSGATTTLSSTDIPGHNKFILSSTDPYDWRSPQNSNLWQGVNGFNNPCPPGWRIPMLGEWGTERASWTEQNIHGGFASSLKLTAGGYRRYSDATLFDIGQRGCYWCSEGGEQYSNWLCFYVDAVAAFGCQRTTGSPIRCIKD